jgi:hypothetical protein
MVVSDGICGIYGQGGPDYAPIRHIRGVSSSCVVRKAGQLDRRAARHLFFLKAAGFLLVPTKRR